MQSANHFHVRGPLVALTDNSTPSLHSIINMSGRPGHHGPLSNIISRLSRRYLTVLLSLMFLAELAGCGPASPDKAQNLGSSASVGGSPLSKQDLSPRSGAEQGPSPRTGPFTTTASPKPSQLVPNPSLRETGQAPYQGSGPSQEGATTSREAVNCSSLLITPIMKTTRRLSVSYPTYQTRSPRASLPRMPAHDFRR